MILTLFDRERVFTTVLPEKITGRYVLTIEDEVGKLVDLIAVEAENEQWFIKSNKKAFLTDGTTKEIIQKSQIEPFVTYTIHRENGSSALLYIEPDSEDRNTFTGHLVNSKTITIGRSKDNQICFKNKLVSGVHCSIEYNEKNQAVIRDQNSSNGTYVNGEKIQEKRLAVGDVISIMGLRIIYNGRLLSLNNPHQLVFLDRNKFEPFHLDVPEKQQEEIVEDFGDEENHDDLFYRSPRFKREIERKTIKIDPPPQPKEPNQTPLALLLGPSLTMGMASLFMGVFVITNAMRTGGNMAYAIPTLVMSFSMLLGTVLWPILTKKHEKKMNLKHEKKRQEKYLSYLEETKKLIEEECEHQREILYENHVSLHHLLKRIHEKKRNLWERVIGQNDFLKIRVGIGDAPLAADIKYPEKKFMLDEDNLRDALYELATTPHILKQVPITVSLIEEKITGIIGERKDVADFVKGIIFQLASLHSYDELKFVFIYDEHEQATWNFAKWLPHVWDDEKDIRFIATNDQDVKELSSYFEKVLQSRLDLNEHERAEISQHVVVFAASKNLADKAEIVQLLLKEKQQSGFSVITLYDELEKLPKECSNVIELNEEVSKIFDKDDLSGSFQGFNADIYMRENPEEVAIKLANIKLASSEEAYTLPDMMTFLEMFSVGKVEHLNALTRWKENNPVLTLETPIGVNTMGAPFTLDLHEKFHGPHGLVAGMTGSGKSEFIMTYILSLAVNYHPDEVAFILIDYKGGGMANAFLDLPHLAGTITNLDGAAVNRSLVSIQSELKRRQAIFSETSQTLNQSNIDIYKYQKLYREGAVKEPLQHLFIISDEFAELKTQQPEFMAQLVSAARIGRSLGIHLILATQKPSGVVDDQIWSNSKFRVSLKVQEKEDSMEMIKRPDAAELKQTGRFYLQVGYNELFELGQSAWAGAPYYPTEKIEKNHDESITIIDNLGRHVKTAKIDKRANVKNPPKQMDAITDYLSDLATQENITVRPLWLEPIPTKIYLAALIDKYHAEPSERFELNPVIGEYDDPANQRQMLMRMPISKEGNTVIYGVAGSGKTTFLSTLIVSLMNEHTPEEVNLYLLDFSSETLTWYKDAPHVGDVVLSHEAEKIENLFKMLDREISRRKKAFSSVGGDYRSYIKRSIEKAPSIIVAIHNYAAFSETYEQYNEMLSYLTREGTKYGIYFILTALNTGDVRYRLLQNFKQLYVMQLNDQTEYSSVLGNVNGVYPSKGKGRGIFKKDHVYEFQIAQISEGVEDMYEFTTNFCEQYAEKWTKRRAKRIPILPETVNLAYLRDEIQDFTTNAVPIGVDKETLSIKTYDFATQFVNLVTGASVDEFEPFIEGLVDVFAQVKDCEFMVIDPTAGLKNDLDKSYRYITEQTEFEAIVVELFNTLVYRNNTTKDAIAAGVEPPEFPELICIIHSYHELQSYLSADGKDKLQVFLDKGAGLNVRMIITDSIDHIRSITYETWFKNSVSLSDAIWVGNGISDQYTLKINKITNDLYSELPAGFGYVITKGKPSVVKLVTRKRREEGVVQYA